MSLPCNAPSPRGGPGGRVLSISAAILAPLLVAFICAWAALPAALRLPSGNDDVNWAKRSLAPWWYSAERRPIPDWRGVYDAHFLDQQWPDARSEEYFYCIDHPAVTRIVYRAALHASGVYSIGQQTWDSSRKAAANIAEGRLLPDKTRNLLRTVNFFFFLAGVLLVYVGFQGILRNPLLAALAALPLALEPSAIKTELAIVPYIGADAMLFFMLALVWAVWQRIARPGFAAAIALGALAGLATATKLNGAFVLPGLVIYFAVYSRGVSRVLFAAAVCTTAAVVFLALNPVFVGPGPAWSASVLGDMLHARAAVSGWMAARPGTLTDFQVRYSLFPQVFFLLPIIGVLAGRLKERWFITASLFALPVIVFNLAGAPAMFPRYAAPVREAFFILFVPCGMLALKDLLARLRGRRRASGVRESCCAPDMSASRSAS
jgi:hypothetical protein